MPYSKNTLLGRLNTRRALHFGIMTSLGSDENFTGATEANYAGYARIQGTTYFPDATTPDAATAVTVDGEAGWQISNTTAMSWGPMPSTVSNIVGVGLFAASTGGVPLEIIPLTGPETAGPGERFRYDVGALDLYEVNV